MEDLLVRKQPSQMPARASDNLGKTHSMGIFSRSHTVMTIFMTVPSRI